MRHQHRRRSSKVPVGATPKTTYESWDDHRRAMRRASDDARARRSKGRNA